MRAEAEWSLQSRTADDQDFRTVYAFADIPRQRSDIEVSNWYTSTRPGTRFTGAPVLARSLPDAGKLTAEGRQLRYVRYASTSEPWARPIRDSAAYARVSAEDFGLRASDEFAARVWSANPQP